MRFLDCEHGKPISEYLAIKEPKSDLLSFQVFLNNYVDCIREECER